MFFNPKEILKELKNAYKKSLTDEYCSSIYIYDHSSSKAQNNLFSEYGLINDLTINNLGEFLCFSNPKVMFSDDLVEFFVNKQSYGVINFGSLTSLKNKDFVSEMLKASKTPDEDNKINLDLTVKLVEKGQTRLALENDMESFVAQYCEYWNKQCAKLLKSTPSEDKIYHFSCESNSMEVVFDGSKSVGYGNSWDFHPGCHGLTSYKGIKFSDWNGAGSLASILSLGLKKKIVNLSVDEDQFSMLCGSPKVKREPEDYNQGPFMRELVKVA